MSDMAIHVRDIRKNFGKREVLGGVSVSFRPGETVAILGPSGGGKSTLLRCLNGLTSFDAGEVQVGPFKLQPRANGHDLREVRKLFGMIFQDFQLFPHLTVLQNVIEAPIRVLGLDERTALERAKSILSRVGMEEHFEHYPRELSGGQKQRVAIARALAMEPRGLFCDEITSSLDPELKFEVLRVLEDLKRDGMTLIMVTHEIGFASRVADRVVMLCDGRILEEGPPSQVLREPNTDRMRLFLQRVMG